MDTAAARDQHRRVRDCRSEVEAGGLEAVLGATAELTEGALLGGLLIAFMINSIGVYVGTNVVDLVTYALLFAFLVLRPAGLTGLAGDLIGPRA